MKWDATWHYMKTGNCVRLFSLISFFPSRCKMATNAWWWPALHDMTWHDMTWHDMTWHDMTWHDICLCFFPQAAKWVRTRGGDQRVDGGFPAASKQSKTNHEQGTWHHMVSRDILSCEVTWCHVTFYHVMSHGVMWLLGTSCVGMSRLLTDLEGIWQNNKNL
jgi:hypothetical protein